jgi:hypothetical protein
VIKFTSCLPLVGGSLRIRRLLPPLKLVAMTVAEIFFWASKKLVTGPNGIMVAQTFCDIFFMKKRHHADFFIFIFF